jgi:hypothetical protein
MTEKRKIVLGLYSLLFEVPLCLVCSFAFLSGVLEVITPSLLRIFAYRIALPSSIRGPAALACCIYPIKDRRFIHRCPVQTLQPSIQLIVLNRPVDCYPIHQIDDIPGLEYHNPTHSIVFLSAPVFIPGSCVSRLSACGDLAASSISQMVTLPDGWHTNTQDTPTR